MAELLDLIESMDASDASPAKLFNAQDDGVNASRRAHLNETNPQYQQQLGHARKFFAEVLRGKRPVRHLQEALTTSDFPNLFGDIIDRTLLAGYQATPQTFRDYCKIGSVRDFRTVKRFTLDGGEAVLSKVAEMTPYPDAKLVDAAYSYSVNKYGRRMPFSFEAMVNDDLDALKDTPMRLGVAVARTEEKFATQLFASSTGPNSTFFSSGHGNLLSGNPVLDAAGLSAAWTALATQTDTEGEPIVVSAVHLVVPPKLYRTAETLLTFPEIWNNVEGGTTNQQLHGPNPWRGFVTLHMNYYLPLVDTTHGTTAWYMFTDPNLSRPAMEVGFLRGYEQPQVFMKTPNAQRVGGGMINPMDGDFDLDAIEYKVRSFVGGTLLDYRAGVASVGA